MLVSEKDYPLHDDPDVNADGIVNYEDLDWFMLHLLVSEEDYKLYSLTGGILIELEN